MKNGEDLNLDQPLHAGIDINLHIPALLPEDYVPDVHLRLMLYKRIASAESGNELRDLQVELIDRFGLLPEATKNLMQIAEIKLDAKMLGIEKIDASVNGGYAVFGARTSVDPLILVDLVANEGEIYRMKGAHRLQFRSEMSEVATRFRFVAALLDRLTGTGRDNRSVVG